MIQGLFERPCYRPRVGWFAVAVMVVVVGCRSRPDASSSCRELVEAKQDAIAACKRAYDRSPSPETASLYVTAVRVRDPSLETLLTAYPSGPIAAEVWHARGGDLRQRGEVESAIAAFERALALRPPEDRKGQVRELASLSERQLARGAVRDALLLQARAYDIAVALGDPLVLAHVRVNLASELIELGDFTGAETALADADARMTADDPYRASALLVRATFELARGRHRLARVSYEQALAEGDEIARQDAATQLISVAIELRDYEHVPAYLAALSDAPDRAYSAASVAISRGDFAEAERQTAIGLASKPGRTLRRMLETARGRALAKLDRPDEAIAILEHLVLELEVDIDDLAIDELKARAEQRRERQRPYEQLFALYARKNRPLDALAIMQRTTARAYFDGLVAPLGPRTTVADVTRSSGDRAEALAMIAKSMRASPAARPPDGAALARALPDAVVWTYVVVEDTVWLAALDHGVATVEPVGTLASILADVDAAKRFDAAALGRLGAALAPPERWEHLGAGSLLHLAVDPRLEGIPFHGLLVGDRRWIERTAIAYVASVALLAVLQRAAAPTDAVVVIGDPEANLPGARGEAEDTARRFGVTAQLGTAARVDVLVAAKDAHLLAVAAHTETGSKGVGLRLADGTLRAAEIVDRKIAPRVVVLASCSSASVESAGGWGALANAFLAAGTPNVIASRWALDDAASRRIVAAFYAAGGKDRPALALATAQREAIARGVPDRAWAALVALGAGETGTN